MLSKGELVIVQAKGNRLRMQGNTNPCVSFAFQIAFHKKKMLGWDPP
jgi:hypothetical protein